LQGNGECLSVGGLDLIALGKEFELLGVLDRQFDCALRPFQGHRLIGRIEPNYISK
jgi:hypothetical protein